MLNAEWFAEPFLSVRYSETSNLSGENSVRRYGNVDEACVYQ